MGDFFFWVVLRAKVLSFEISFLHCDYVIWKPIYFLEIFCKNSITSMYDSLNVDPFNLILGGIYSFITGESFSCNKVRCNCKKCVSWMW